MFVHEIDHLENNCKSMLNKKNTEQKISLQGQILHVGHGKQIIF